MSHSFPRKAGHCNPTFRPLVEDDENTRSVTVQTTERKSSPPAPLSQFFLADAREAEWKMGIGRGVAIQKLK
jgi:hypothetical protein